MRVVAARAVRAAQRRGPGPWRPLSAPALRAALRLAATPADRVEHVYVETGRDALRVVLFVLPGGAGATTCAQLVRRTLAAVDPGGSWAVRVGDATDRLTP